MEPNVCASKSNEQSYETDWNPEARFKDLEDIFKGVIVSNNQAEELEEFKAIWITKFPESAQKKIWNFYVGDDNVQ